MASVGQQGRREKLEKQPLLSYGCKSHLKGLRKLFRRQK